MLNHTSIARGILALFIILNFSLAASARSKVFRQSPNTQQPSKASTTTSDLGQLLYLGISSPQLTHREKETIREIQPGGVILFKRNIQSFAQIRRLTKELQSLMLPNSPPLFIAVDQEGGRVVRVKTNPPMISPAALGHTGKTSLIENYSFHFGLLLRSLGINMNLAPVLDVAPEDRPTFIGERSFGSTPGTVSDAGVAFANGQLRSGVLPTGKHFPGGGDSAKDTHIEAAEEVSSLSDIESHHLAAFKKFLEIFPAAVMLSHLQFNSIEKTPATFSKKTATDLLRGQMGFKGLAITDDLMMSGARQERDLDTAVIDSLSAGADMALITWSPSNQLASYYAIERALLNGNIDRNEVLKKIDRIKEVKSVLLGSISREPAAEYKPFDLAKMIRDLDSQVLETNLDRELLSLKQNLVDSDFVIYCPPKIAADLKPLFQDQKTKARFQWMNSETNSLANLKDSLLKAKGRVILAPITNKKIAMSVKNWPDWVRQRTISVSTIARGNSTRSMSGVVLNLDHPHPNIWNRFALKVLLSIKDEDLKSASTGNSTAAQL